MKLATLLLIFFYSIITLAYIPNPDMIIKRTTENHGSGMYLINLEIVIPAEPRALILKEQWMVKSGKVMRVRVTGLKDLKNKVAFTFVYNHGKKYFIDQEGKKKSVKVGKEWSEEFLHSRRQSFLKNYLLSNKIVPREVFTTYNTVEKGFVSDAPYISLSRQNGKPNYLFSDPPEIGRSEIRPAVWIEQDNFVISKVRFPSGFNFSAESFVRNNRGLWYPQKRTFTWGSKAAFVQTLKVLRISSSDKNKKRVSHYSLLVSKEPELKMKMPDIEELREFYSTFR